MTTTSATVLLLLGASTLAIAQTQINFAPPPDTSRGFWRMFTDPTLRNTTVRFFDGNRQVLYEETLNGRYLELNRSNILVLDKLLAKLTARELVSTSVKAKPLADESTYYKSKPVEPTAVDLRSALNRPEGFEAQTRVVSEQPKLLVQIANPPGYRVHLFLEDKQGQSLFYHSVVKVAHVQTFRLTELPEGIYTIRVTNYNQKFQYRQRVEYRNSTVTLLD